MCHPLKNIRETHTIGPRCREAMLDSLHAPALRNAHVSWVGHSILFPPYRMIRLHAAHSHVVATLKGRGQALLHGEVVELKAHDVYLAPVGAHHAYEVAGEGPWQIVWIFFDDSEAAPALQHASAELRRSDAGDFEAVVKMLLRETAGPAKASAIDALASLLHTAVQRITGVERVDLRLAGLWERLEANLAHPWSVPEMARLAGVSEEHLRRLCHRFHHRSPAAQLTHLRMRRASSLLRSTPATLEDIAHRSGYGSPYSFSVAFRRWSGISPARYRRASLIPQ